MNYFFLVILLLTVSCIGEESFVMQAPAKSAAPSVLALKEDYVYAGAELLQQIGAVQEQLGRIQKGVVANVFDIVEGTNTGSFAKQKTMSGKQKEVDLLRVITRKVDELNALLIQSQKNQSAQQKN